MGELQEPTGGDEGVKVKCCAYVVTAHTNERVYSHSDQSTDTTVSTHASDYVYERKEAKPRWVQMGGGACSPKDDGGSDRKTKVVEKNYVDYGVGDEGRRIIV